MATSQLNCLYTPPITPLSSMFLFMYRYSCLHVLPLQQNWDEGVFRPPNPKSSMAKASSKLFFINRFRGKKHKKHSSPTRDGVLQDTSNKPTAREVDTHKSGVKVALTIEICLYIMK